MLTSYQDKGPDKPWAVGLGHTNANNLPPFVDSTTRLKDDDEARAIFKNDIVKVYAPQLDALFAKINFKPPNEFYRLGFLGALYNRGYGRIEGSLAYDWLKHPERPKYMIEAAVALTFSHAEGFIPLDTAWDHDLQKDRVYLGLQARRASDTALCLMERWQ